MWRLRFSCIASYHCLESWSNCFWNSPGLSATIIACALVLLSYLSQYTETVNPTCTTALLFPFPTPSAPFQTIVAPPAVYHAHCPSTSCSLLQIPLTTKQIPHNFAVGDCPCCSRFFYLCLPLILLRRSHLVPSTPGLIFYQTPHSILVQSPSTVEFTIIACLLYTSDAADE